MIEELVIFFGILLTIMVARGIVSYVRERAAEKLVRKRDEENLNTETDLEGWKEDPWILAKGLKPFVNPPRMPKVPPPRGAPGGLPDVKGLRRPDNAPEMPAVPPPKPDEEARVRCCECKYGRKDAYQKKYSETSGNPGTGLCEKHAPSVQTDGEYAGSAAWPIVDWEDGGCWEGKPKTKEPHHAAAGEAKPDAAAIAAAEREHSKYTPE